MEKNFDSYRDVIRYEYQFRHHKNPAYSMRSFARDLGLAPSRLSEIVSGKQGLSAKRAQIVGKKIGYQGKKLVWFCDLVDAESSRSLLAKNQARQKLKNIPNGVLSRPLSTEIDFDLRWYHLAIRRIVDMKDFDHTPFWIAHKLHLNIEQVEKAIADLIKAGLLRYTRDGKIESPDNIHLPPATAKNRSKQMRIFKTILWKAYKASDDPPESRHHGLHMFTLDQTQMGDLKAILQECEDKIDNLTYKAQKHDQLVAFVNVAFCLAGSMQSDQKSKSSKPNRSTK